MSSVGIPRGDDLKAAYAVVENHIAQTYGIQAVSSDQIESITRAAFRHMQHDSPQRNRKWTEQEASLLIATVKKILISAETPWKPTLEPTTKITKLTLSIIRGQLPTLKEILLEKALLKAVVWKKDTELLKECRHLINDIFIDMFNNHNLNQLSENESLHMEMVIGDLLSLLPFLRPEQDEQIQVPIRYDGKWQFASYKVAQIELTPSWMGSPLMAYGLNPQEKNTPPLLLFKGTTFPTDSGCGLSLLADLNPGASVGSYAFRAGKNKIDSWLNSHAEKAVVYGKSLGGALACRSALYFPDKVAKVLTFGAPGFTGRDANRWNKIAEKPQINMFYQKGDPVPYFDKAPGPNDVNYYQVYGQKQRRGVLAHADMFSGHKNAKLIKMDPAKVEHKYKRLAFTALRASLSVVLFPFIILIHASITATKKSAGLIDRHIIKPIHTKITNPKV